jgi:hypothetical protein
VCKECGAHVRFIQDLAMNAGDGLHKQPPTKIYKTRRSAACVKTVALKDDTYAELAALKAALNFRSFDDVVKHLLSACRRG